MKKVVFSYSKGAANWAHHNQRLVITSFLMMFNVLTMPVAAQESKELSLQFSRYDQLIDRLMKQNEQLMGDLRTVQRENLLIKKELSETNNRAQVVADELQKLQNMSLNNLVVGQKQMAERLNRLDGQNGKLWGEGTRDCTELRVKHQQIKVQTSPDGNRSVKFLCYDGKALHLATEVHDLGN